MDRSPPPAALTDHHRPDRRVVNAATMWHERRNSAEIARALHLPEPAALRLLDRARQEGLLP